MYLLDANVFIQAKNLYYRFDTFPGFWEWLDEAQATQQLASIEPILQELLRGTDALADWCRARKQGDWFLPVDDEVTQQHVSEIAAWVMAQPVKDPAKMAFLGGADPWLIAKARTLGAMLVTHEKYEPGCKKKILIPNICKHYGIPWLDTFAMMGQCRVTFKLSSGV